MASIEDDKHVIALYMTADFFRWDGWNVEMLGGSIPNKDLVTYLDTNVPNFCFIIFYLLKVTIILKLQ